MVTDTGTTARPVSLWHHRDLLKLWTGQTASLVGSQVTLLAPPLTTALTLRAGPFQMGVLRALHPRCVPRSVALAVTGSLRTRRRAGHEPDGARRASQAVYTADPCARGHAR